MDTVVPNDSCGVGQVTINSKCVSYRWDLAQKADYHDLPEPLAETSGAVVGHEYVVFGDGDWHGNAGTSDTTKKTFVYDFKTRRWDSNRNHNFAIS